MEYAPLLDDDLCRYFYLYNIASHDFFHTSNNVVVMTTKMLVLF